MIEQCNDFTVTMIAGILISWFVITLLVFVGRSDNGRDDHKKGD